MIYSSLQQCINDLEKEGELIRIKEEVDPFLEMAAIHLRVHELQGPALFFENIKGCRYKATSNLFGTIERSKFIFRSTFEKTKKLIALKQDPALIIKNPFKNLKYGIHALYARPLKNNIAKSDFEEIHIQNLPLIQHWPKDGGAFITLPQVYTEDTLNKGIAHSNIGMYRIQLSGNDYLFNKEIGLHYQLHRGIGVHQTNSFNNGESLKVSIFIGGPPAHSLAAVMPLPEELSEVGFAGIIGGRRFRYFYDEDGFCISADSDFVITGEVNSQETKPEGPFGDHLGYYSLQHNFPLMQVKKVYAKRNAIWPFTVVGRPPQEDTSFGKLIHELTGEVLQNEINGLVELNAVDAAGVHPLLLAIGKERYAPYNETKYPAELLTIANHILGKGQLSLAKFLFITEDKTKTVSTSNIENYFSYILERVDFTRDIHFYTNTTIDTLDYSGTELNKGSKVVIAACGDKKRNLDTEVIDEMKFIKSFSNPLIAMPGVLCIESNKFANYKNAVLEIENFSNYLKSFEERLKGIALIIVCDDSYFTTKNINNFLWVTFTRSNPSHDIYGVNNSYEFKHWGCKGPLIIDARIKQHHAPALEKDPETEKKVDRLFNKGGSLYKTIK